MLLFGAKRLPQIGEGLGKTVKEIRKIRDERKAEKEKKKGEQKEGEQKEGVVSDLKKEVEEIPGVKEAKEIKQTVNKVKRVTKFLK